MPYLGPHMADEQVAVSIPLADGSSDPAYVVLPADGVTQGRPLVVSLHSWGGDSTQRWLDFERECVQLGWVTVRPNYRGPNLRPEACASDLARQDILTTVEWMHTTYGIDRTHVFLVGVSGGGHMAMMMAGRHPTYWRAVSAWVGIANLWQWRDENPDYWNMIRACMGPGLYDDQTEHLRRSPVTWLTGARDVPLDIAAGINDPSVPYHHSVDAFNVISQARGGDSPDPGGYQFYERAIITRRYAGLARLTVFDGVHEGLVQPTVDWILRHMGASQLPFVPNEVLYAPTRDPNEVLVVGRKNSELRNVLLRSAKAIRDEFDAQSQRATVDQKAFIAALTT